MELTNKPSAHEQEERTPAQPSISMEEAKDQKHGTASARQLEPVPRKIPLHWLPVHPYYQVMDPGLLVLRCQQNHYPTTLTGLAGILGLEGGLLWAGPFLTLHLWVNFGIYWGYTFRLHQRDLYRRLMRFRPLIWFTCAVQGFIADLWSTITTCLPRSLTVRYQQSIFALFTYLSCPHLPPNVKVLQLPDKLIIVLYHILLSCLILTE